MRRVLGLLACMITLVGCVKKEPVVTSGGVDAATARAIRADGVSIAPVVFLQDFPAPPIEAGAGIGGIEASLQEGEAHLAEPTVLDPADPTQAAFLRNEYVGNVRFGGGFIRTGGVALEVRARLIELGLEGRYREDGARWLGDMLPRVLTAAKVPIAAPATGFAPAPERRRVRGMHPEDGHDNVNLPRSELLPTATSPVQAGSRWVMVPYLRLYYTHNGGWFLGQTWGCMAGARVEALVALYDTTSGRPVWSSTVVGRHVQGQTGQATTAQMEQYLIWAEQAAEAQLSRGWLR